MKNIFKTFVFVFALVLALGVGHTANAAWNNASGDCVLVRSSLPGSGSPGCLYSSSLSGVNPGDTVTVYLYFHNTGSNTESGRFTLNPQVTGTGTNHTISGTLQTPSGSYSGSTNINTNSAVSLTYIPGSVKLYRYNQYASTSALPSGQNGSELFSGGLYIGDIPGSSSCPNTNTFCEQGTVTVQFRAGSATPTTYQCNNGYDDDGDGRIDYPNDPGCSSSTDNYEGDDVIYSQCSINSFYPAASTVSSGSYATLYWTTSNCDYLNVDGVTYSTNGNGNFGPLYSGRSYTLTAWRSGQSQQTRTTYVGVNTPYYNTTYQCNDNYDNDGDGRIDMNDQGCSSSTDNDEYNYVAPVVNQSVFTSSPTGVTQTTARLNGILTQYSGNSTQVYFEWGFNQNVANTTVAQTVNNGTAYFDTLTNLSPNTTYYYRAVAVANGNTSKGDIMVFKTAGVPVVINPGTVVTRPTVVTNTTTVVERGIGIGSNLVSLKSANQSAQACVGDNAEYVFSYKNISEKAITDAVIQVSLPKDLTFTGSSAGIYNNTDHTVTINLGTIQPQEERNVTVRGIVKESALDRDLLVATATMSFTNPYTTATESAVAYGLVNTSACVRKDTTSNLAGLALFGGGFLPGTLVGWLLLLLVVLGLVLLARQLFLPVYAQRKHAPHIDDMNLGTDRYHH